MPQNPPFMSDHPGQPDVGIDVVSEILDAAHLTTAIYGRLELGSPWRLKIPARPYLSFYVVTRGSAWIDVGEPKGGSERTDGQGALSIDLSVGDAVLLPRGTAHALRDVERSSASPQVIEYAACPRPWIGESARFGGVGPATLIVTGQFTFSGGGSRSPLLDTLPPLIHIPAGAIGADPQLAGVVPLILNESAKPGPGASIVLARLADLLLIHGLRYWMGTTDAERCGLHAVTDPSIGAALQLIHARPADAWTVKGLASAVAMSRSTFSARFRSLVGIPPLRYLAQWRMTVAARLLASGGQSVPAVAQQVGYSNPAAFAKAFSRFHGTGPGAYRRGEPGNGHAGGDNDGR